MKLGQTEIVSLSLAAAAVTSVLLVFFTQHEPTTAELAERREHVLSSFREEEVELLQISQGTRAFTVERGPGDGTFLLRTPAPEPADGAAVERLIDELGFATVARRVQAPDLGALGFATPRATLTVSMRGRRHRLGLGNDAPAPAGGAYLSVASDGEAPFVVVVGPKVRALFFTPLDDLRDRALVKLGPGDLAEIALERPDASFRLVRGKGSGFLLDGRERASRDALDPVLTALAELRVTRFLAALEAERTRGDAPRTVLRLKPRDAKAAKVVLELGGACPGSPGETLAIVRDAIVRAGCVRDDALRPFGVARDALGDDSPFSARVDEVETLTIARGSQRLVLARRGTGFSLSQPASADVDIEAGNQRLRAIVRAPGELVRAPDLTALGLGGPGDRVTLTVLGRDDRALEETLELGRVEADGSLPVRRAEDGAVLRIGRDAARAFLVDTTLLRDRRLLDFPLSALLELELSGPERQVLQRAPSGFSLATPAGFDADGELATNVVLGLGSLTALRWVADADDGSFGLGSPRLSARIRFEPGDAGPRERTLFVGTAAPGGDYARLSDADGVFLLERALTDRLQTLLLDRSVTMADPGTLARVTLDKDGVRLVLERRGGELVPAPGSRLDPSLVVPVVEALAGFRAEAALHTGAARPSEGFAKPSLEIRLEPSAGLGQARTVRLGAQEVFRGLSVRFVRVDSVPATFVVADAKARVLYGLF